MQWTDASATEIIGATEIDVADEGGKQTGQLGVITDGHIRLLKLPKSVSPTFYGIVAFWAPPVPPHLVRAAGAGGRGRCSSRGRWRSLA